MGFEAVDLARAIVLAYEDAELRVLRLISTRLATNMDSPQWATIQAAKFRIVRNELQSVVDGLERVALESALQEVVIKAYERGDTQAVRQITRAGTATSAIVPPVQSTHRVMALLREAQSGLRSTHHRILRQSQDVYRDVIARASVPGVVGVDTRRGIAQQALNQFANKGVTGFVDRSGRGWDLTSYAEMSTRTTTARASLQGHADRLQSNGYNLVIVSAHWEGCPLCDPYEGAILSLDGDDRRYPSLQDAIQDGLYHPNCVHSHAAYIEGMTRPLESDVPYADRQARYEATQEQRYNERQIRQWKRREAVALSPKEADKAKAKVAQWQSTQRTHVAEWDLRRKYERESLTGAR